MAKRDHLTCIIVDDEPPAVRILEKFAAQLPHLECVATATKALDVLQLTEEHRPDLLFLDIQMPDLTGLQLSAILKDKVKIIFTTAYPQFALEGFENNAVDYLLKPIAFERFVTSVEKARKLFGHEAQQEASDNGGDDFFFVKTDGRNRFKRIATDGILYVESIRNYVVIHTKDEQVITYNTLKSYEESLPSSRFIKIHKSYIVALDKIEKTDTGEVWINGKSLPLGDTYKAEFFERIERSSL